MNLEDAKVLVTGGSSGIGKATAKHLAREGAEVVIAARTESTLNEAAEEIGATPIVCDVREESMVIDLVKQTVDELGGFNVLINNAGYGHYAKLVNLSLKDFQSQLQVNTLGAMLVARESAKHFIQNDYGNIINVSSSAGKRGYAGGSAYCASKFALGALTECWRDELRPHNIRVMQMNPSEVQTKFFEKAGQEKREFNESKLIADDIAQAMCDMLRLPDRGFITETSVWATNPK